MKIVGSWIGTVGNERESMVINGDGTFVCHLQKTGFIASMLYPAPPGTVSGTWAIVGSVMSMTVSGAKSERLENRMSSSVIVAFHECEYLLILSISPFWRRAKSFSAGAPNPLTQIGILGKF